MADLEAALQKRYLPSDTAADLFLCPDAADLKSTRLDEPDYRAELWTIKTFGGARSVVLGDFLGKRKQLPPALAASPELRFLQVPQPLASQLRDEHVRNLTGELRIRGEGIADLLAIGAAPGVTHLGGYKIDVRIKGSAFPALQGLATWDKNRKRLVEVFSNLPKLRSLFVAAYKGIFSDVPVSLGYLQLLWGTLETMDGIAKLPNLEWVIADRVSKLRSLDGLEGHEKLIKVNLNHCAALEDVRALARCPNLRFVTVSYCKLLQKEALAELAATLQTRGGLLKVEA